MRPLKQATAPPAPREGPERSGGPGGQTILSREEWRAAPGENRLAGRLRAVRASVPLSPSCWDGPSLWRTSAPRFTDVSAWADRPDSGLAGWGAVAVSHARRCPGLAREDAPQRAAVSRYGARSGRLQPRRQTGRAPLPGQGRFQPASGRPRFRANPASPTCSPGVEDPFRRPIKEIGPPGTRVASSWELFIRRHLIEACSHPTARYRLGTLRALPALMAPAAAAAIRDMNFFENRPSGLASSSAHDVAGSSVLNSSTMTQAGV